MSRCKNCGVEMSPEETCVFATYRTSIGGREIVVCCPNCARDLEQAAAQSAEDKPSEHAPSKKAPPKKVKRPARAAKKAPRKKAGRKKVKNPPRGKAPRRRRK